MFTGIVTHQGVLAGAQALPDGRVRLALRPDRPFAGLEVGASVAVDGVCLTVVDLSGGVLAFDVVPETLRRTTLGSARPGQTVNLERALRVGDELGGHWVQGHVDGTAEVVAREQRGADVHLSLRLPPELRGAVISKGSITLDGVSLTVGEVWSAAGAEHLRVYLIPHTLTVTTLGRRQVGDRLNVEGDVLGRWLRQIAAPSLRS